MTLGMKALASQASHPRRIGGDVSTTHALRCGPSLLPLAAGLLLASCGGGSDLTAPASPALRIITTTTGAPADPNGYRDVLDQLRRDSLGMNDTLDIASLDAGTHTLFLDDVATGCQVADSNPRTARTRTGGTTVVTFSVTCQAAGGGGGGGGGGSNPTGTVTVSAATSGDSIDADGYSVSISPPGATQAIAANGSVSLPNVPQGTVAVILGGVASNCTVASGPSRTVQVTAGGTTAVRFDVTCVGPGHTPAVQSLPPTAITATTFRINGQVNAHGIPTTAKFEWGWTSSSITSTCAIPGQLSDTTYRPVSCDFSNLIPDTTVVYRLVADNAKGRGAGAYLTASTTKGTAPVITSITGPTSAPSTNGSKVTLTVAFHDAEGDVARLHLGVSPGTGFDGPENHFHQMTGSFPIFITHTCTPAAGQTKCPAQSVVITVSISDNGENQSATVTRTLNWE
jgi:hypothetical protein